MRRLGPNLATLDHLLQQNQRDFRIAIQQEAPAWPSAATAWRRLVRRRNKAVRLVEELNLRTQRLQPLLDKLAEIAAADADASRRSWPSSTAIRARRHAATSCAASCTT